MLWGRGLLTGSVLDFGSGYGKDVQLLQERGIHITGYDPHYAPAFPNQKFDTILCLDVLNILLPEEQAAALMDISYLLRPGGKAYIAVRRDQQYEGYRSHKAHRLPVYQGNVRLPYASLLRSDRWEVYEYWHYTWLHRGNTQVSPFFEGEALREMLVETTQACSFFAPDPVSPGHALIIPKRLTAGYFDLSFSEQTACWSMVNRVKQLLTDQYHPDGFSISMNDGEAAGQRLPHAHIQVIPRYAGDAFLFAAGTA
jgi:diadenosine tetraphosphate (Ap4A) HIT family hydrolase